jgi:hypothetical protein
MVGVMVRGTLLGTVEGKLFGMVEGKLLGIAGGILLGDVGEGILVCVLAFKIRRKNENRITAKIAILTHEFESIADS